MKIPEEIVSFATQASAGQKLIEVLAAVPEKDSEVVTKVIDCFVEVLREQRPGANGKTAPVTKAVEDLSTASSIAEQIMFLHPRGKHCLAFFPDRMVIQTSKQQIVILSSDVTDVVILDSIPKDTKNRVWILLNFKEDANIMNGKTRMRACVIQVQADQEMDIPHPKNPSSRLSGNAAVVLCQAIGCCGITNPKIFHSSSPDVFKSCTSTSAVEAFVKARQGHLFPLQQGICFLESPAIFIHVDQIRSVDFARAGGASSTFDFQIHLKNKNIEEFSNISRHELSCIQDWVNKLRLPVGFPSYSEEEEDEEEEQASGEENGGNDEGEEVDSDDDDDDFNPYHNRSKKRKTSGEEEEEEEELDDDDEEEEDNEEEDSSSDDDDGVELVSEEDFKIESLQKMISEEKNKDM